MIHLSPAAYHEIRRLMAHALLPTSLVRLSVKPGGCATLYYSLELIEQAAASDRLWHCEDIDIATDVETAAYLGELTLDFAEDLMGGAFRFHNSKAIASCECGNSFSIESGI